MSPIQVEERGRPGAACGLARRGRRVLLAVALALAGAGPAAAALEPDHRAAAREAFAAASAGQWARAAAIMAPVPEPLLQKTFDWLHLMAEDGRAEFAAMARFVIANPDWPFLPRTQILAEERLRDPADHELIRRFFQDRPPLTTRGRIRYAEALLRAGEDVQAEALLRQAWMEGELSKSEEQSFLRRHGRLLSAEHHVARLHNLLWEYRRDAAARMLERVPRDQRLLAQARLSLQRKQGGVDGAIRAVPGSLQNDPGLLFDRLRWRRQKQLHEGAIVLLLDPPAELGRPALWWFERELQIRRALRKRDFALAYDLASEHGQTEGTGFADAEWLAGWLALRFVNQPRHALRHFERLYAGVTRPVSRSRAAYWAGRAAAALGDDVEAGTWYRAAARYQVTFYGQLAGEELGEPHRLAPAAGPEAAERAAFEAREPVRAARLLIEVGADDLARPFLIQLAASAKTPVEVGLAAELAAAAKRPDLVVMVGKYAAYDGVVNEVAAFPIPEWRGMTAPPPGYPEPALLLGVARQESVFNPSVVSRAGARGLLQLMPTTAYLTARQLGLRYNRGLLTGDPDYNVRLGSYYLKTLLERFREPALALAGYNAGPGRVDEWMRLHGDPRRGGRHELVDWLELIPFEETRNYVQRVMENYGVYRLRLQEAQAERVGVRVVNGPLDPLPVPSARPPDAARAFAELAPEGGPPEPELAPAAAPELIPAVYPAPPVPQPKPGAATPAPGPWPRPELKPRRFAGLLAEPPIPAVKPITLAADEAAAPAAARPEAVP